MKTDWIRESGLVKIMLSTGYYSPRVANIVLRVPVVATYATRGVVRLLRLVGLVGP